MFVQVFGEPEMENVAADEIAYYDGGTSDIARNTRFGFRKQVHLFFIKIVTDYFIHFIIMYNANTRGNTLIIRSEKQEHEEIFKEGKVEYLITKSE